MTSRNTDRRSTSRRHSIEEHGIASARIRPGKRVTVIDVSMGGALVETHHRLLPGTSVELHLQDDHRRATVRGRVLRCYVARIRSTSVCYRGAILFDRYLPWFAEDESAGYSVPCSESRPGLPGRADVTHRVV